MKGRVPWPGGSAELDGTPEEFARLAALMDARTAAPEAAAAKGADGTPAAPTGRVASPQHEPGEPQARAAAGAPPGRSVTLAPVLRTPDDALEDDGEVPSAARIRDFLASRPDFEHSIQDVFQHFGAGPVSPTLPDGTLDPAHQRWMAHINKARALVIQEKKGFFKTEWRGGAKVYVFWYAPFQDYGTVAR